MMAERYEHLDIPHEKKIFAAVAHHPVTSISRQNVAVILTHGAGGDMHLPQLVTIADRLAGAGFLCLRFTCKGLNITYRTKVYTSVLEYMYHKKDEWAITSVILAGRSMGARAAAGTVNNVRGSHLNSFVRGVICLSYPLHPPNDKNSLRDDLLKQMKQPCLVVNGDRDKMCECKLMERTLNKIKEDPSCEGKLISLHWIADSDHGLTGGGRPHESVITEVADLVIDWCGGLISQDSE